VSISAAEFSRKIVTEHTVAWNFLPEREFLTKVKDFTANLVHQLSSAKVGQDFHAKLSKLSAKNSAMGKRRDITLEEKT
jgi:hypothetical protein